jgi:hypothetical protein
MEPGKIGSYTRELYIEHNRPFTEITYIDNNGQENSIRCWLDSGAGAFIITEFIAQKLGIPFSEAIESYEGNQGKSTHSFLSGTMSA